MWDETITLLSDGGVGDDLQSPWWDPDRSELEVPQLAVMSSS